MHMVILLSNIKLKRVQVHVFSLNVRVLREASTYMS